MENENLNKENQTPIKKDENVLNKIKKGEGLFQKIGDEFLPENFNPFLRFSRRQKITTSKIESEFEERVIDIKRVIKVTKGGRRFKFSALVVVGDKKGNVGFAVSKHIEVPEAIKKASRLAKKNLFQVKIVGKQSTISHEYIGHHGAAKVLLKPASEGRGIIASNTIRAIVELAGIRNIYSKNLGTNNPQSVILATLDALKNQRTKKEIMFLRNYVVNRRPNFNENKNRQVKINENVIINNAINSEVTLKEGEK